MDVLDWVAVASKLAACALASSPLKLLLLYLFAWSTEPWRGVCISSTLLARLCPGRAGVCKSSAGVTTALVVLGVVGPVDGEMAGDCWVGVRAVEDAVMVFEESLRRPPLR